MIVTKKHLSRRTFLRGVFGTTVALPLLDAMIPALVAQSRTAAAAKFRFGAIYTPNGMCPGRWEPAGEGAAFELSPILEPFAPVRAQMTVVSGLFHSNPGSAHMTASGMWLNGVFPKRTEGADVSAGTTVDQLIAAEIGQDTLLPSLELGTEDMSASIGSCEPGYSCLYMNTLAWRAPTAPLPVEVNPRAVFQRLFGETGTTAQRAARLRAKSSILDAVKEDVVHLQGQLGAKDRVRLDEYLENIRQVERRIQRTEQQADLHLALPTAPRGIPESFEEHVNLLFDLQLIAFQADLTRVFTFLLGHEASDRTYPQIGVTDSHHSVSHPAGQPEQLEKYAKINLYHSELVSGFVKKMGATPDGDGTLLDHSLLLYGSGMSNGELHDRTHLPLVLFGGADGRVKSGRRIVHETPAPLSNLLVSIGEAAGLKLDKLGESTGRVSL